MRKSIRFRWKRWLLLCVGLLVMAFGVAFSIKGGLGTSPISSLPYVISRITPLTVGTATIAMHVALILLQILLLRRRYQLIQLLQLPVALLFGMLTDAAVNALQGVVPGSYPAQWGLCLMGIALVGIGVSMEVTANVVVLAGEGMVLAVCQVFPVLATALSFLFLGHLEGVREGTVVAAICVGMVVKLVNKPMGRFAEKYLS